MSTTASNLHSQVNQTIIKCRGVYSLWSKKHNISYNKMLVLYTIREYGCCTQKQICDNYLLPRQTINNIFTQMRREGLLTLSPNQSQGKEKSFIFTDKGAGYYSSLLASITAMEQKAAAIMGTDKIQNMIELVAEYDAALIKALEEESK